MSGSCCMCASFWRIVYIVIAVLVVILILVLVLNETAGWFSWTRQSNAVLRSVEKRILSCVKAEYKQFYVDIGPVVGRSDKIWTISMNEESSQVPILLLHGLGAGVAFWCLNLDSLAAARPVYAIDVLGFGLSSHPKFSSDPVKAEAQLVRSVEEWRREMKLDSFVLLGHSLGGFIASAYAIEHPDRVQHLILADPWGFPEKPSDIWANLKIPIWARPIYYALQPLNPMWPLRMMGPAGSSFIRRGRVDLIQKFDPYVADANTLIPDYIHQCNAQTPSGEGAFHTLMHKLRWAKNPMVRRLDQLSESLSITVLHGARSWVDNATGDVLRQHRPNSFTDVQVMEDVGHHVYLDKPELFNRLVLEACARADKQAEAARSAPATEPALAPAPALSLVVPVS